MFVSRGLNRFAVVLAICSVFFYEYYYSGIDRPWPECTREDKAEFVRQLGRYRYVSDSPAELTSMRKILKGDCMFSKDYVSARNSFLEKGMRLRQSNFEATLAGFKIGKGSDGENKSGADLVTDYVIVRGSKKKFMFSFSGVHGPEGFAGSAVQQGVLEYFLGDEELMKRYSEAAVLRDQQRLTDASSEDHESLDEMSLPPTLVIVHAINPFGMANNRRVNEDNIDLNRNYLHDELLHEALSRDPNHAGYVSANFFINPTRMPSSLLLFNDIYGYVSAAGALLLFGLEGVKKALLGGNYHDPKGQGYGGMKQSASVRNVIKLLEEVDVSQATRVSLVDLHTGLGPSGTDTLAILQPGEKAEAGGLDAFNEYIERAFPEERDPHDRSWWAGRKALKADSRGAGNPMSGYEKTIGTVDNYCNHFLAPQLAGGRDLVCVTQEFGTVPVVQVGMAQRDENFAWHYGTEAQRQLYGERLKHVFFVQERGWMRSVVHRGLTVFKQALRAADGHV